tara:strand:- start:457 stop:1500 length:1044 start_codon:yes stop_codon:yes gene_type:complete
MKVSIGTNIKDGPWGGGNLFAINLKDYLLKNNHQVVNNLSDDDIDIILITEPRKTSESSAYTHVDVFNYLRHIKEDTLVVHRINECDERKNTNYVNTYLMNANMIADSTVFVSKWLKSIFEKHGINNKNNNVIYAGANQKIFNDENFIPWDGYSKINFVTHHWGANWNKGFETYLFLDDLIGSERWRDKLTFTYIGNLPNKFSFKNTKVVEPMSGKSLAEEIKKSNIYITGSLNEPSGNHHIEAAQCGLPIFYIDSGGIPEYCKNFGIEFNTDNLESKLLNLSKDYPKMIKALSSYPFNSEKMCKDYLDLFSEMLKNKENYVSQRNFNLTTNFLSKKVFNIRNKFKI